MFCPKCGSQVPDDTAVCPICRLPLAAGQARQGPQQNAMGGQQGSYPYPSSPYQQAPQPHGDQAMAQMARQGAVKALSGAQNAMTGVLSNAGLASLVCAAIVLVLAFVSPWMGSPLYKAMAQAASTGALGTTAAAMPKSVSLSMPQIVGTASAYSSLMSFTSALEGSSSSLGLTGTMVPPRFLLVLYLFGWLVVAVLVGVCVEKLLSKAKNLPLFACVTLGIEFVLTAVWIIAVFVSNNSIKDTIAATGGESFYSGLASMGIPSNTAIVGITFWTIIAIVISAIGLAIALVTILGLANKKPQGRGANAQQFPAQQLYGQQPYGQQPYGQNQYRQ